MSENATDDDAEALKSFTSWKLTVLEAIMLDRRVSDAAFRFACRVMYGVKRTTGLAELGDETACAELGIQRDKAKRCRTNLEAAGWLAIDRSHGGRGTYYRFHDEQVQALLNVRLDTRAALVDERKRRREEGRRKASTKAKAQHEARRSGKSAAQVTEAGAANLLHRPLPEGANLLHHGGENLLHVHLQGTPTLTGLPSETVQDEALGPPVSEDDEDRRARFDEVAAYLQHEQGLSRGEAEFEAADIVGFHPDFNRSPMLAAAE